jgi:hypothetical protein
MCIEGFVARFVADVEQRMSRSLADEELSYASLDIEETFLAGYCDCSRFCKGMAPYFKAKFEGEERKEVELSERCHCRV